MAHEINLRPATRADAPDLAYLHALASGGMVEFIYDNVVPGVGAIDVFAETLAGDAEPYTWRNCTVADGDGQVVGKLHTFPADDEAKMEPEPEVPEDRYLILAALLRLEAPGTWYISAVAVRPGHQGRGLDRQFLQLADKQARDNGFDEITLHVFEDNTGAIALYEFTGFKVTGRQPLDHPALTHHAGDMLLMRCEIA